MPLERNFQASVLRRFKALHVKDPTFVYRKRHGSVMGITGDPDLYGVWRGLAWGLELKRPGEDLTRLQAARHEEWGRAGVMVGMARSMSMPLSRS